MANFVWRNRPSNSARALARSLGFICNRRTNPRMPRRSRGGVIVNWGCHSLPDFGPNYRIINDPGSVGVCVDKRLTNEVFAMNDIPHPQVINTEEARDLIDRGKRVAARLTALGHSGRGLHIISDYDLIDDPEAEEWTINGQIIQYLQKYVPKKAEYRIHFVRDGDSVHTLCQRKMKRRGVEVNSEIRTHDNGWVYVNKEHEDLEECVHSVAQQMIVNSGLQFGAADVIYNQHYNRAYALEINSAPGLEGPTTLNFYTTNINIITNQE